MSFEGISRRPKRRPAPAAPLACALAGLALGCAVWAVPAAAMTSRGDGALSPRLAELAKPAVRSLPPAKQAKALSLAAEGPGSLLREGNRVLAEVRFESGAAAATDALRAAGAKVVDVSPRYQTVTVAAKPAELPAIGEVARVGGVTEVLTPIIRAAGCPSGATVSEGDAQLNAAGARSSFALDGSGVTVGILSDSFDRAATAIPGGPIATHAHEDVLDGDLPGTGNPCGNTAPVGVLDDSEGEGADEGRAMAQIVHDLAPGANIDFATAFTGETGFASNIRRLAAAGAKVIADDVGYFEEPFFQDGPIATAVDEVTAVGVSYFSSASNDNLIDSAGRDIASWEAPAFRDSHSCPPALVELSEEIEKEEEEFGLVPGGLHPNACMDFDPAGGEPDETFGITVSKGATLTVDLQWAEPWNGVATDIDAYLIDQNGEVAAGGIEDNVGVSQKPVEVFQWENGTSSAQTVQLVVNRFSGAASPRLKVALLQNGGGVTETEYPESSEGDVVGPTVFGHAGSAAAIGVGAVRYSDGSKPERYSSRGPVRHYFGPVVNASPAPATGEQVIAKPDLAATDCGATTFFARPEAGVWRFCGTSAAAPHAAAVAALVRQANPGASAAQVRSALTSTARPVGAFGPDAVGAGLLDAYGAVAALALPPAVAITKAPQSLSRNRWPTIEFSANRPAAFACAVDGGAPQACASPFTVPAPLRDGPHGISITGTDAAGRTGSAAASFVIDTKPPRTRIVRHPRRLVRTHRRRVREVFRFRSSEAGSTFVCKLDRGLPRPCGRRIAHRFGVGRHAIRVRARDRAGNLDRSPAIFHFRVKRLGRG